VQVPYLGKHIHLSPKKSRYSYLEKTGIHIWGEDEVLIPGGEQELIFGKEYTVLYRHAYLEKSTVGIHIWRKVGMQNWRKSDIHTRRREGNHTRRKTDMYTLEQVFIPGEKQ
jgi:hypothetical protein